MKISKFFRKNYGGPQVIEVNNNYYVTEHKPILVYISKQRYPRLPPVADGGCNIIVNLTNRLL